VDGDLSEILKSSGVGQMIDFEDVSGLKETIKAHYHNFRQGELEVRVHDIEQYKRKNLTAKLVHLIREVTEN